MNRRPLTNEQRLDLDWEDFEDRTPVRDTVHEVPTVDCPSRSWSYPWRAPWRPCAHCRGGGDNLSVVDAMNDDNRRELVALAQTIKVERFIAQAEAAEADESTRAERTINALVDALEKIEVTQCDRASGGRFADEPIVTCLTLGVAPCRTCIAHEALVLFRGE